MSFHRSLFPVRSVLFLAAVLFAVSGAAQPITSLTGYTFAPYDTAPAGESLVSFDFDPSGDLYTMTGDPGWALGLTVYRGVGVGRTMLFDSAAAFPGSRVTVVGPWLYFNDGGDYARWDFNYYVLPLSGGSPVLAYTTVGGTPSLWGADTRDGTQFFASGATNYGPSEIFFTPLSGTGALDALVSIGQPGDASGPLAFDAAGDLFYAPGYVYSGQPNVFRWTAAEVAAALADPAGAPLSPGGHVWGEIPAPFTGASGMVVDTAGSVYVTANVWGAPGELLVFRADADGASQPPAALGRHAQRLGTLRLRGGRVYVNCAEGVYSIPEALTVRADGPLERSAVVGESVSFSVTAAGGSGDTAYEWHRVTSRKADTLVGTDAPVLTVTPQWGDEGAQFYCLVSDAGTTGLKSPVFTLDVTPMLPAVEGLGLAILAAALAAAGARRARRQRG